MLFENNINKWVTPDIVSSCWIHPKCLQIHLNHQWQMYYVWGIQIKSNHFPKQNQHTLRLQIHNNNKMNCHSCKAVGDRNKMPWYSWGATKRRKGYHGVALTMSKQTVIIINYFRLAFKPTVKFGPTNQNDYMCKNLLTHCGMRWHLRDICSPFHLPWCGDIWKHISSSVFQDLDQSIQQLLFLQLSSTHNLLMSKHKLTTCLYTEDHSHG